MGGDGQREQAVTDQTVSREALHSTQLLDRWRENCESAASQTVLAGGRDRVGAWQECRLGDQGMMGGRRTQSSDCYGRALVQFFTCRAHARQWQLTNQRLAPLGP